MMPHFDPRKSTTHDVVPRQRRFKHGNLHQLRVYELLSMNYELLPSKQSIPAALSNAGRRLPHGDLVIQSLIYSSISSHTH